MFNWLLNFPVIWKEQVVLVVGSRRREIILFRGCKSLPQGIFMVTCTFRISALNFIIFNIILATGEGPHHLNSFGHWSAADFDLNQLDLNLTSFYQRKFIGGDF